MTTITIISILIIFILGTLFGWSDTLHYYYKYQGNGTENIIFNYEHELWSAIRFLAFLPIWYIWFSFFGMWSLLGILANFLVFPFFHDGMYYTITHKFTKKYYKKTWTDCTSVKKLSIKKRKTDTIYQKMINIILKYRISFNWTVRLGLFVIGLLLFLEMVLKLHF